MIATSKHIVKQQILDLSVPNLEDEVAVSSLFAEVYKQHIEAIIDEICEDMIPGDQVIRLDSLTVDLGPINFERVRTDFPRAIKNAIKEELYRQIRDGKVETMFQNDDHALEQLADLRPSNFPANAKPEHAKADVETSRNAVRQSDENAVMEYFNSGIIPWYYQGDLPMLKIVFSKQRSLAIRAFKDQELIPAAKRRALHFFEPEMVESVLNEVVSKKLRMLFEEFETFKSILKKISEETSSKVSTEAKTISEMMEPKQNLYLRSMELLFTATGSVKLSDLVKTWPKKIRDELREIVTEATIDMVKWTSEERIVIDKFYRAIKVTSEVLAPSEKPLVNMSFTKEIEVGESFTINNAGLILTWPYLQAFFTGLNLMRDQEFLYDEKAAKAAHLLHYLVFNSEEGDETMWLLNKLLCGLPISEFVPEEIKLTEEEKEECDHLLVALIKNWPALKNTSPNSLRSTFLQRDGLLVRNENGWTLKIDRKAFDILLDRLNWTISAVKLPWNNYMINTEW